MDRYPVSIVYDLKLLYWQLVAVSAPEAKGENERGTQTTFKSLDLTALDTRLQLQSHTYVLPI